MTERASFFDPSDRALAFGAKYAEVLASWSRLFDAASSLTSANVELGQMASDAAKEFDQWMQLTAMGPWAWLNPESLQQLMRAAQQPPPSS